jgi:hypothetical protein
MTYDHFTYLSLIAARLNIPEGNVFKASSESELQQFLARNTSISGVVLIGVDSLGYSLRNAGNEAIFGVDKYGMMILKRSSTDENTVQQTHKTCREYAQRIIAYMLQDNRKTDREAAEGTKLPYKSLVVTSVTIDLAGPVMDNFYGVIVNFEIQEPFPYKCFQ